MTARLVAGAVMALALAGCGAGASMQPAPAEGGALQRSSGAPSGAAGDATEGLSTDGSTSSFSSNGAAAPVPSSPPSGQGAGGDGTTVSLGTPSGKLIERSLAAAYTVPHGQFLASFNVIISRAVGQGGYVVSSSTSPDASGTIVSGTVTVQVPAATLATLIADLPASFTTSSINFASVDHTAEFTDFTAQITAAKAQRDALIRLMASARNAADLASLQQQVATLQAQIDKLQGALDRVQHSLDYATAAISISERGAVATVVSPWKPVNDATSTGLGNIVAVLAVIIASLLSALPFLLIAFLLWLTRRRWMRAFRSAQPAPPVAAPAPEVTI